MADYESVLFVARECFVYRVPSRSSAAGYKAAEWGDMEAFLWKGRLRIIEKGEKCDIRLEDSNSGDLFALCPYDIKGLSVEPVLDSSRYFVLRVESDDPEGGTAKKRAFIGMGFQDRSDSFDFNVVLQDWTKRRKAALAGPSDPSSDSTEPSPHLPAGPRKDYSLKEGETFSIKIPGAGRKIPRSGGGGGSLLGGGGGAGGGGGFPILPPPPSKRG